MSGEQLAFFPEPALAPTWPAPGTIEARALDMLLDGRSLTTPEFEAVSNSWRLAAVAERLRCMGWPIEARMVPAPTFTRPGRHIACYSLPHAAIAAVLAAKGVA